MNVSRADKIKGLLFLVLMIVATVQVICDMTQHRIAAYASCGRCQASFYNAVLQEHITWYDEIHGTGCFPLCQTCWANLSPPERVSYYRSFARRSFNEREFSKTWPMMRAAVLAGK